MFTQLGQGEYMWNLDDLRGYLGISLPPDPSALWYTRLSLSEKGMVWLPRAYIPEDWRFGLYYPATKALRDDSWGQGEFRMNSGLERGGIAFVDLRPTAASEAIIYPTNYPHLYFSSEREAHRNHTGAVPWTCLEKQISVVQGVDYNGHEKWTVQISCCA